MSALRLAFEETHLDFGTWLMTTKRSGVFMYGINHPRPVAIAALAHQVASDPWACTLHPCQQPSDTCRIDWLPRSSGPYIHLSRQGSDWSHPMW